MKPPSTVVVGLGNPYLRDDRVGLEVARRVAERVAGRADVSVHEATTAGLDLVELLAGHDRAVLVDALVGGDDPGRVRRLALDQLPPATRCVSVHELDLSSALALARRLGQHLPTELVVIAIEVVDASSFGERMTPAVAISIPLAVAEVLDELDRPW